MELWAELNGVRLDGCDPDAAIFVMEESIGGLGLGPTTSTDQARVSRDGAVSGTDRQGPRTIPVPLSIYLEDDPAGAMRAFRSLKRAWRPSGDEEVLRLHVPGILPEGDEAWFYGRPRGDLDPALRQLHAGQVYVRAQFVALDPVMYGPEEVQAGTTLTNDGDTWTDRAVIEITGNGGTPSITNPDDGSGAIGWLAPLANAAVRLIDLRTFQVTDGAGVSKAGEVSSGSTWFTLQPGTNTLSVSGVGAVETTLRPGYL